MQVSELKKQREREEQPYIFGHFEGTYNGAIYFVLENRGNSPALNVETRFDPSPAMHSGVSLNDTSIFRNPILFFAPGTIYRQLVDVGHNLLADNRPTQFSLEIRYKTLANKDISDRIEYDLEYLKGLTRPPQEIDESLADLAITLRKVYRLLENRHIQDSLQRVPMDESE